VTGWRSGPAASAARCLGACVAGIVCLLPAAASAADRAVPGTRLFAFQDDEILESSGLVDRGDVVYTNNDSGDDAVVYGVDPATGETVSRTTYAASVEDVEAIAPGSGGTLWAGDIGDNRRRRDDIAVYRVRPVDGEHPGRRFTLTYPDGPHDAETLLVEPRTQRVFVVSKSPFGGVVYAAPRDPVAGGRPNRLRAFARVGGLVTDGSFLPDGRHVLLRTYGTASVYTFPAFALVGTVRLPAQPQGEGISVGPGGRVLVSSEGVHADVLQVRLPSSLTAPSARPVGGSSGPRPSTRPPADVADRHPVPRGAGAWVGIGVVAAAIAGVGYLTVRGSRIRTPR
jgi:hypothetical protein